ncbi:uncharacterized protein TM35_000202080 [Trypanosoma theileri]|uniref:Uncharacterized protein n=1 Tax=Trypanosoma theileri TaxID=67003 RepID=A0A1X0NUC9_9TRYP|nr:uncharacterized protein TM35_000202080 [Trypanosoma theileri]ORC87799.1 hypothetical protein TM35_000202080 [Trypanosoma theileri]
MGCSQAKLREGPPSSQYPRTGGQGLRQVNSQQQRTQPQTLQSQSQLQKQQQQQQQKKKQNATQGVETSNISESRSIDSAAPHFSLREGHVTTPSTSPMETLPRFKEIPARTSGTPRLASLSSSFSALVASGSASISVSASAPPQASTTTAATNNTVAVPTPPTTATTATPATRETVLVPPIQTPQAATATATITGTTPTQKAPSPSPAAGTGATNQGSFVLAAMAQIRGDRPPVSARSDHTASPRRYKMNAPRTESDDIVSICVSSTSASSLQYFLQSRASGTNAALHSSSRTPRLRHGMLSVTISPLSSTFVTPRMPAGVSGSGAAAKTPPTTTTAATTTNTTVAAANAGMARPVLRAEGSTAGVNASASRRESSISKSSTLGVSSNSNTGTGDQKNSKDTSVKKTEWVPFSRTNSRHSSRNDLHKQEVKKVSSSANNTPHPHSLTPTPATNHTQVNNNSNNNNVTNKNSNITNKDNNYSNNTVAVSSKKAEGTVEKKGKDWVPFSRTNSRGSRSHINKDGLVETVHHNSSVEVHDKKEEHGGRKERGPSSNTRSSGGSMGNAANNTTGDAVGTSVGSYTHTKSPQKASNTRRGMISTTEQAGVNPISMDMLSCSVSSSSSTVSSNTSSVKGGAACNKGNNINININNIRAPLSSESDSESGGNGKNDSNVLEEKPEVTVPVIERFIDAIRGLSARDS